MSTKTHYYDAFGNGDKLNCYADDGDGAQSSNAAGTDETTGSSNQQP